MAVDREEVAADGSNVPGWGLQPAREAERNQRGSMDSASGSVRSVHRFAPLTEGPPLGMPPFHFYRTHAHPCILCRIEAPAEGHCF